MLYRYWSSHVAEGAGAFNIRTTCGHFSSYDAHAGSKLLAYSQRDVVVAIFSSRTREVRPELLYQEIPDYVEVWCEDR